MKYLKLKFLLMFFALAMAIPPAWAETVSTTIFSTTQDGSTLTWSNNSLTFSLTQKPSDCQYSVETSNSARGLCTNAKTGTHVLTSDQSFEGVTTVEVIASTNGSNNTISVSAGDDEIGTPQTIASGTANANNTYIYQSTNPCSGKIVITINDVNKSVWIKSITVTYQEGGNEPTENLYKKVTSDDQIVAGKKYILVAGNYAMGAVVNQSTAPGVEVTIENNTIDIAGTEVAEYVLSEEHFSYGNSWGYNLILNGQSIGYAGSGKFGMVETPSLIQYYWTFISSSNGYTVRNSDSDYKAYSIRMLTSSHVFAPYKQADSNTIAYLYVQEGSEQPVTPPSLSVDQSQLTLKEGGGSFNVTGTNLVDNVGVTQNPEGLFNLTFTGTGAQNWGFQRNDDKEVNGTVNLEYTGRELYVTGTIIPGTDPYENAPDEEPDLTAPVTVTYQPDVYLYGDFGGGWGYPEDAQFDYANGVYSQTVSCDNTFFIMFARKAGENYNWQDNRYFFSAKKTNYWTDEQGNVVNNWVYNKDECNELELSTSGGQYHCIQLPAGEYKITINAAEKTFSITSTNVANIAEAQAFDGRFNFTGNAVVTYHNQDSDGNYYTWIRDVANRDGEVNSGLILGDVNNFTNGDVLNAGWKATKNEENTGIIDFINPEGLTSEVNNGPVAPYELTTLTDDDLNKYVSMSGLTVTKVNGWQYTVTADGTNTFYIYDQFHVTEGHKLEVDKTYNVVGVVSRYNGNPQLYLISAEEVQKVETPTFEPAAGTYYEAKSVTIACETQGATIHYTTDGSEPTATSAVYSTAIPVSETTTIKAIAMKEGWLNSSIAEAVYTIKDPSSLTKYTKVTSTSDLTNGNYLIVYEDGNVAFDGSLTTLDGSKNTFGVEISSENSTNTIYTNVDGYFTYDVNAKTLKSASGYYIGQTAYSNGLKQTDNEISPYTNTITIDDSGNAIITAIDSEEGNKMTTLRYNKASDQNRFRYYTSGQQAIQIYKSAVEPQPELAVTLPEAPEEHYKVGQVVKVKATVENGSENTVLTYNVGEETLTIGEDGNVTLPNKKAGNVVLTVTAVDGDKDATDTKTYVFDPAEALTITLDPATGTYTVGDVKNVTVTVEGNIDANPTITYKFGEEGEVQNYSAETGIVLPTNEAGTINLTVMVDDGGYEHTGATTATGTYTVNHKALTITLNPATAEFTVGAEAKVKVTVENAVGDYVVSGMIGEKNYDVDENGYITLPNDKAVEEMILTVTAIDDRENAVEATATGTYTFTALPAITFDLSTDQVNYTVGDVVKVKATDITGTFGEYDVTYMIGETTLKPDEEGYVTIPSGQAGDVTLTVTVEDLYEHESAATQEITFHFAAGGPISITLTADPEAETYTVGDVVNVKVTTNGTIGNDVLITYMTDFESKAESTYDPEEGIDITSDKAGTVTLTVNVYDGYAHEDADENGITTKTADYTFVKAPAINITFDPASGTEFTVGQEAKVKVTIAGAADDYEAEYKIGDNVVEPVDGYIVLPNTATDDVTLTVSVYDGIDRIGADESGFTTATATYTFSPQPVVAAPTFSLVAGSYGEAQQLTISAENGANILYSTDGSEPTTPYNGAISLGEGTTTVKAVATKDGFANSPVVTATYIIDIPEELPTITPFKGYYQIKNNENNKYANIAGRKTLNFTDDINKAAGTVIRLETDEHGKVDVLRSQAADLQRYADRVVEYYVPKAVELVVEKLQADGAGNILGENGLDAIMDKFNESFDHHLYVEPAEGGYRIYGKTPSMQPVVDFYREHTAQVEAKLPMLESFINSALDKLKQTIGGGGSIFQPFSLLNIWERMGGTLTKPEDDASIMAFYREVLNNKNYVWDFAYQTATFYLENLKNHERWPEVEAMMGEYAQYFNKLEQVRPDFKYYIVADGDKPDFISEGNVDINNNAARTIWTVEPRTTFTVNVPENNKLGGGYEYVTTLYTDFAYDLPEGVTAYKVTGVTANDVAELEAIEGTIPAQTPVLLKATTAGDKVLTLNVNDGTIPTDNLLVGPDFLINYYDLTTPQLANLFQKLKEKLGEDFYNSYVKDYEYLMKRNSGTVNNKYFWNVNADLDKMSDEPIVRDLAVDENGKLAFSDHWTTENNKAFLVDTVGEHNVIYLSLRGDINRDGLVNISDVTALIDILLELEPYSYAEPSDTYPRGLDYEAADVNLSGARGIADVTALIDIILSEYVQSSTNGN